MDTVATIICFFSHGYTQDCVGSLREFFPEMPILFVDNNPGIQDSSGRRENFLLTVPRKMAYERGCHIESEYIRAVPNAEVIQTDGCLDHGHALQLAFQWCASRKVKYLVHLEPDCLVEGRRWYDDLCRAIVSNWVVFGGKSWGRPHLTPSIWDVSKTWQFPMWNVPSHYDETQPWYDDYALDYERQFHFWDTAVRAWIECLHRGKAVAVRAKDFKHIFRKGGMRFSVKNLLNM